MLFNSGGLQNLIHTSIKGSRLLSALFLMSFYFESFQSFFAINFCKENFLNQENVKEIFKIIKTPRSVSCQWNFILSFDAKNSNKSFDKYKSIIVFAHKEELQGRNL